jgi:hypothetical protein
MRPLVVDLEGVRSDAAFTVSSAEALTVSPGQSRPVEVTVRRLGGGGGNVTWSAGVDRGLSVSPASGGMALGRGDQQAVPLTLTAPPDLSTPAAATLTITVGGEVHELPVTVDLATRLGAPTASSTHSQFSPEGAIDGDRSSETWGAGNGWNDNTGGAFPDWLAVAFDAPAPVGSVDLYTLDAGAFPAGRYGVRDADVQLRIDGEWRTVAEVRGNTAGTVTACFEPVEVTAVRVLVHGTNDGAFSRIVEVEARPR